MAVFGKDGLQMNVTLYRDPKTMVIALLLLAVAVAAAVVPVV